MSTETTETKTETEAGQWGGTVTATVLAPETVEIGGRVYTATRSDGVVDRLWAEEWRLMCAFDARLGASGDPGLQKLWGQVRWAEQKTQEAETTELLRFVGKFLVDEQRRDLWRLLYLELRHRDHGANHSADRIMMALLDEAHRAGDQSRCGEYREGDECLFVFGPQWRMYLDEDEEDAGQEAGSAP